MKVGDTVIRVLAGVVEMPMVVRKVSDTQIEASPEGWTFENWTFDKSTGAEIDDLLEWGPNYGATGSFLKLDGPFGIKETNESDVN